MIRTILPVSLVVLLAAGCDSDCQDASRLNGTYAMWHSFTNVGAGGTVTPSEDYPSYTMFVNGWSKWKVKASTTGGSFNTDITDFEDEMGDKNEGTPSTQPFSGDLSVVEANCNAFTLHIEGTFETTVDTEHTFVYDADLLYTGDHLNGSFTYSDSYVGTAEDGSATSGQLDGATGEFNGTLQYDDFDADFTE